MPFCSICGAENKADSKFCYKCGTPLSQSTNFQSPTNQPTSTPATPQPNQDSIKPVIKIEENESIFKSTEFKVTASLIIIVAIIGLLSYKWTDIFKNPEYSEKTILTDSEIIIGTWIRESPYPGFQYIFLPDGVCKGYNSEVDTNTIWGSWKIENNLLCRTFFTENNSWCNKIIKINGDICNTVNEDGTMEILHRVK